jgi:hypothetical protein
MVLLMQPQMLTQNKEHNPRAKCGNWAGGLYGFGNLALIGASVLWPQPSISEDSTPYETIASFDFLISSGLILVGGQNKKLMGTACVLGTVGWTLLAINAYNQKNAKQFCISTASALGNIYGIGQSFKKNKDDMTLQKEPALNGLKRNWKSFNEKYPYGLTGGVDFALKSWYTGEAVASHDWPRAAVGLLWMAGATCFSLALPKGKKGPNQPLFDPA